MVAPREIASSARVVVAVVVDVLSPIVGESHALSSVSLQLSAGFAPNFPSESTSAYPISPAMGICYWWGILKVTGTPESAIK